MNDRARRRSPIAQAISLILGTAVALPVALPALAQETLEEVVVTGIRGSLTSSMNLRFSGWCVATESTPRVPPCWSFSGTTRR